MRASVVVISAVGLFVSACGSSTPAYGGASSGQPAAAAGTPVTVSSASVAGVGTVLVDGTGRTLYVLSSEKGGNVTCTDASGCTAAWPHVELPAGTANATAGNGITASLLGTVTADGHVYVTYAGYPLYTFAHDSGPMQASGQGISSFGGTWMTMNPSGTPVSSSSPNTSAPYTVGY